MWSMCYPANSGRNKTYVLYVGPVCVLRSQCDSDSPGLVFISVLELQRRPLLHRHSRANGKHCERLLAHGVGTAVDHSGHAH